MKCGECSSGKWDDCGAGKCNRCGVDTCTCGGGSQCSESDLWTCADCQMAEMKEHAWMGRVARQHVESCWAMGIRTDSADAEVMAAARGLR